MRDVADAAATDYGSPFFGALREASVPEWRAYTRHDFVTGLADGSLRREAYLRYLRQDYVFLIHFARAWALFAAKADRIDEIRPAAATVHALIDTEMRLHIETCAAEGIGADALAATEEAPATLAYTRFVIDAGFSGDGLDLLVALVPCVFGYGEIGRRLAVEMRPGTPYAPWIATYAGEEYQTVCREVATLLESVVARRIGDQPRLASRWPGLVQRFATACRLEADFWEMGLGGSAGG